MSELRVPYGAGYRVYFARMGETMVVLLCGGDETTQPNDIKRAQSYWAEFRRRMS